MEGVIFLLAALSSPEEDLYVAIVAPILAEYYSEEALKNPWCKNPIKVSPWVEDEVAFRLKTYSKNPAACFATKMDPKYLLRNPEPSEYQAYFPSSGESSPSRSPPRY